MKTLNLSVLLLSLVVSACGAKVTRERALQSTQGDDIYSPSGTPTTSPCFAGYCSDKPFAQASVPVEQDYSVLEGRARRTGLALMNLSSEETAITLVFLSEGEYVAGTQVRLRAFHTFAIHVDELPASLPGHFTGEVRISSTAVNQVREVQIYGIWSRTEDGAAYDVSVIEPMQTVNDTDSGDLFY